jgi:hypothetical protein
MYKLSPDLTAVKNRLIRYMTSVGRIVKPLFDKYESAPPEKKQAAKEAYSEAVRRYTTGSREYNAIIRDFVRVLSKVTQQALDAVNAVMPEVYKISYNQISEQCKEVGIKVKKADEIRKKA